MCRRNIKDVSISRACNRSNTIIFYIEINSFCIKVKFSTFRYNIISNISGIYPSGEGAGYAGGIMSAAVDGIKCAIAILEN